PPAPPEGRLPPPARKRPEALLRGPGPARPWRNRAARRARRRRALRHGRPAARARAARTRRCVAPPAATLRVLPARDPRAPARRRETARRGQRRTIRAGVHAPRWPGRARP